MTLKQQAKKELSRIKKSMTYREKKYGISFPKTVSQITERILGRDAKKFSKRDIQKLSQIKGSELYRFGQVDIAGEKITGYKTEEIVKDIQYANREQSRNRREKEPSKQPKYKIPRRDYESDRGFVLSTDQIINDFLNPAKWNKITEKAMNILREYVSNVLENYTREEFATVLEQSNATGQLLELRLHWYKLGISSSLEYYLGPYFGYTEMLRDFDNEINEEAEEEIALSDFEQAMGVFGK